MYLHVHADPVSKITLLLQSQLVLEHEDISMYLQCNMHIQLHDYVLYIKPPCNRIHVHVYHTKGA